MRLCAGKGHKRDTWGDIVSPAAAGGEGDVGGWGGKRPPERLFVDFSRRGPRGSWRPRGTAAHSPCSARRNAAQEDRKEAGPFFTDALSVRLTAGLKLSNKTGRGGGAGAPCESMTTVRKGTDYKGMKYAAQTQTRYVQLVPCCIIIQTVWTM